MKKTIYNNENWDFSDNLRIVIVKLPHKSHKIHTIENKIIVLLKINTTPITKKILVMRIRSKNQRRSTFYPSLVGCLALKIQAFLMDTIIIMPAILLLQIFYRFFNKIQYLQNIFSEPIYPVTYVVKKNITIYIPLTSNKAIYLPKKLQYAF